MVLSWKEKGFLARKKKAEAEADRSRLRKTQHRHRLHTSSHSTERKAPRKKKRHSTAWLVSLTRARPTSNQRKDQKLRLQLDKKPSPCHRDIAAPMYGCQTPCNDRRSGPIQAGQSVLLTLVCWRALSSGRGRVKSPVTDVALLRVDIRRSRSEDFE